MSEPAVEIRGVSKRFGNVRAVESVDLKVEEHEFVSLLGPSGCGKSTLLRIVAGFEAPSAGRVLIHGRDVTHLPPEQRPTNIVFQRGALFPHMNLFDNVAYGLKLRKWPKARIAARVEELLALVRLENLEHRGPTELSGGQIQRAALARALAAEPTVLLLDEALSALDLKLRQQMQLELRAIQRKLGATFIYVTHDQTEALVMSDRIAVMNQGRIVQEGTPREIYTRPASIFTSGFIGETNLVPGVVVGTREGIVTLQVGEGRRLCGESSQRLEPGARATLSVRPEAIRLSALASSPGASSRTPSEASPLGGRPPEPDRRIPGTVSDRGILGSVSDRVYLGGRVRLGVQIGGDLTLWVELPDEEAQAWIVGSPVTLDWPPSAAGVWADEAGVEKQ